MSRIVHSLPLAAALLAISSPLAAKDSLGVYGAWAAFRDAEPLRCYAIARPRGSGDAYASVGNWPGSKVRGQIHIRLSRVARTARLAIGSQTFTLVPQGRDAWTADKTADAAILAAMRSAGRMTVSGRAANGGRFIDRYSLEGAATAMDAAVVGCAR